MKNDLVVNQLVSFLEPLSEEGLKLVLIGGCSRSGKSTLSQGIAAEIRAKKYAATVLSLDSWIVGVDRRPEKSTVYQRYDGLQIIQDVRAVLEGKSVVIPVYDAKTRMRVSEQNQFIHIHSGYLILEGVLALAYDELRQLSALSVFVEIDDQVRKQRFKNFYSDIKGLSPDKIDELFNEREIEEVLAVKKTRVNADILIRENQLSVIARDK